MWIICIFSPEPWLVTHVDPLYYQCSMIVSTIKMDWLELQFKLMFLLILFLSLLLMIDVDPLTSRFYGSWKSNISPCDYYFLNLGLIVISHSFTFVRSLVIGFFSQAYRVCLKFQMAHVSFSFVFATWFHFPWPYQSTVTKISRLTFYVTNYLFYLLLITY